MAEKKVKVGLVQTSVFEDTDTNLRRAVEMVREAAKKGAKIVCLPELLKRAIFHSGTIKTSDL